MIAVLKKLEFTSALSCWKEIFQTTPNTFFSFDCNGWFEIKCLDMLNVKP